MKKDIQYYKDEAERYHYLFGWRFDGEDKIAARAAAKEDQRLYRKVGKKFIPVNDP